MKISYATKIIAKAVGILNEIAGWMLAICMLLITINVILRTVFGKPILGTYEWVGILTALCIGLGLAFCAYKDSHITIDFLADKLNSRFRKALDIVTGIFSSSFMAVIIFSIFKYASKLYASGEVSPTTRIPFYIFVFITGFGFVFLTLTLILKTLIVFGREDV